MVIWIVVPLALLPCSPQSLRSLKLEDGGLVARSVCQTCLQHSAKGPPLAKSPRPYNLLIWPPQPLRWGSCLKADLDLHATYYLGTSLSYRFWDSRSKLNPLPSSFTPKQDSLSLWHAPFIYHPLSWWRGQGISQPKDQPILCTLELRQVHIYN